MRNEPSTSGLLPFGRNDGGGVHYSLFIIHYSLFMDCFPSFAMTEAVFIVHYSLFIIHGLLPFGRNDSGGVGRERGGKKQI
jgi:hypothetical protein